MYQYFPAFLGLCHILKILCLMHVLLCLLWFFLIFSKCFCSNYSVIFFLTSSHIYRISLLLLSYSVFFVSPLTFKTFCFISILVCFSQTFSNFTFLKFLKCFNTCFWNFFYTYTNAFLMSTYISKTFLFYLHYSVFLMSFHIFKASLKHF